MNKILDQLTKAMIYVTARLNALAAYLEQRRIKQEYECFGLDMSEERNPPQSVSAAIPFTGYYPAWTNPQYEEMLVSYPEVKQ